MSYVLFIVVTTCVSAYTAKPMGGIYSVPLNLLPML
jgi:hypothetical protein